MSLNTADGIENWAKVIHKDKVGITKIYKAIPSSFNNRDRIIRLSKENNFDMNVVEDKMINE